MGSCVSPKLLKCVLLWLRGGFLLRLLGLPCILFAVYQEVNGGGHPPSLILHRLRRLRLSRLSCLFRKGHGQPVNSFFFVGGADVLSSSCAHPQNLAVPNPRPKPRTRKPPTLLIDQPQPSPGAAAHDPSPSPSGAPPLSPLHLAPPQTPQAGTRHSPCTTEMSGSASHSRNARSMGDVVTQGKRLSLQFPISPTAAGSSSPGFRSPRSRPQSWAVAAPSPILTPEAVASPTAETNFLAVLAAQERYVLELREELAKAEEDLKRVKKHWATHQALKQRNELRGARPMTPLASTLADVPPDLDDEDGSAAWLQKEMERRKSLLSGTKTSHRKVFSGSRHLRTLSLLSTDRSQSPSFPQPSDIRDSIDEPLKRPPQALTRAHASSDATDQASQMAKQYDISGLSNMQRDALLRTGKQMATDFKDGLLTFIEDIRQATVGEEPIPQHDTSSHPHARSASAKGVRKPSGSRPGLVRAQSSKHSTSRTSSTDRNNNIADDFWKEHGLSEPTTTPASKRAHTAKQSRTPPKPAPREDFDDWDDWDTSSSPNDKKAAGAGTASSESDDDNDTAPSGQASSRTSARYHSKRHDSKASTLTSSSIDGGSKRNSTQGSAQNSIPWPDLVKLSPTNLKRTASHLMKEWEKMTPPPETREGNGANGDYLDHHTASPVGLP